MYYLQTIVQGLTDQNPQEDQVKELWLLSEGSSQQKDREGGAWEQNPDLTLLPPFDPLYLLPTG